MDDPIASFFAEVQTNIQGLGEDAELRAVTNAFATRLVPHKYSYNFTWLGRPIIQIPQDIVALQEIIWRVKPELIVETGTAHGGGLVFYASMLEVIGGEGSVLGIELDMRQHNRAEIDRHPMRKRISILDGSSVDEGVARKVHELARGKQGVLVCLDSSHTHQHVRRELELYSDLVRQGSYLVVFDTIIEDLPENLFPDRPWGKGNNPKTAVWDFLRTNDRFVIDKEIQNKLVITVSPDGYLKCVKD